VLPLVDLRTLLGLDSESAVQDDEGRMLVVRRKETEAPTALVVDGLRGIAWMRSRPARPESGTIAGQVAGLLTGAGEHREAIVHILDVDRLFKSRQLG
jgi:chemotaxis signal transduction protein